MKRFEARVAWQRDGQPFLDGRYSRAHAWRFDGGRHVAAASSPSLRTDIVVMEAR
ncbi:hypothetical protein [Massilia phyllostachyos]|uniref:hypothetical protein n=1 Tax=Massilia phyllostachyos TaxID=2898585 RepID=UPI0027D987F6|nr:hypothetical protein [Massilia phyllostachyos]